tara:strand:+ start:139 stop:375 length:237 start_codon:yes stop_codon:yes gene_type:complete
MKAKVTQVKRSKRKYKNWRLYFKLFVSVLQKTILYYKKYYNHSDEHRTTQMQLAEFGLMLPDLKSTTEEKERQHTIAC